MVLEFLSFYLEEFHQTGNVACLDTLSLSVARISFRKSTFDVEAILLGKKREVRKNVAPNVIRMYLEIPRLFLKIFVAFHLGSHILEILLHLLAEAIVQTREIRKARNPKVEMKDVIFFSRKNLSQKCGLL